MYGPAELVPPPRSPFSKKISKQAREVLLEYGLPPLGTKESPNPAYIIFLSVSRSPKDSACWSTRYSLSARVISLSNSREFVASDTIRREGSTISNEGASQW